MAAYKNFTYNLAGSTPPPWGVVENQLDKDLIDTMVADCHVVGKSTGGHQHGKVYDTTDRVCIRAGGQGEARVEYSASVYAKIVCDSSGTVEISTSKSDGSDTGYLSLSGGGAALTTRGAHIFLNGNEAGGKLTMKVGDGSDAELYLGNVLGGKYLNIKNSAGTNVHQLDSEGNYFPSWDIYMKDNKSIKFGAGSEVQMMYDTSGASNVFVVDVSSSSDLPMRIDLKRDGYVSILGDDTGDPFWNCARNIEPNDVLINDILGSYRFSSNDTPSGTSGGGMFCVAGDNWSGPNYASDLVFKINVDGTVAPAEIVRISHDQKLIISNVDYPSSGYIKATQYQGLNINGIMLFEDGYAKYSATEQDAEPEPNLPGHFLFWKDTNDSDRIYLLYKRGTGDVVKVELT